MLCAIQFHLMTCYTVACSAKRHLTLKQLVYFFKMRFYCLIFFHSKCNSLVWNWSDTMNILSALWQLMAWWFSTRAAMAPVLIMHPCISSRLGVKKPFWNQTLPKCMCLYTNPWQDTGGYSNREYPSETDLKIKSCEILFDHNLSRSRPVILKCFFFMLLWAVQNFKMIHQLKWMFWCHVCMKFQEIWV